MWVSVGIANGGLSDLALLTVVVDGADEFALEVVNVTLLIQKEFFLLTLNLDSL